MRLFRSIPTKKMAATHTETVSLEVADLMTGDQGWPIIAHLPSKKSGSGFLPSAIEKISVLLPDASKINTKRPPDVAQRLRLAVRRPR